MRAKDLLPGDRFRFTHEEAAFNYVCTNHGECRAYLLDYQGSASYPLKGEWEVELIDELDNLKHLINEIS